MMAAGTRRRVLDRWSIGALGLLGLLLSRTGVIRRTRTIERTTRHGIKWRTCTFHTGSIFSTAISKHRTNVRVQTMAIIQMATTPFCIPGFLTDSSLLHARPSKNSRTYYVRKDEPHLNNFSAIIYFAALLASIV